MSPELRSIISSHALLAPLHSPTLLEIPPNFTLLRLSDVQTGHLQTSAQHHLSAPNAFQTRNDLAEAIKVAIGTHMHALPQNNERPHHYPETPAFLSGVIPDTRVSYALSLATIPTPIPLPIPLPVLHAPFLTSDSAPSDPTNPYLSSGGLPHVFSIGNLYLSSCPGKKGTPALVVTTLLLPDRPILVRLDGPVNGRSGVCRNLEVDMARMRRLGVACIVWLDQTFTLLSLSALMRPLAVSTMMNSNFSARLGQSTNDAPTESKSTSFGAIFLVVMIEKSDLNLSQPTNS